MSHPMEYFERIFIINLSLRTGTHDLRWYHSLSLVRDCVAGLRLLKNALKRR